MSSDTSARIIPRALVTVFACLPITACLSTKLKQLEISQLQTSIQRIQDEAQFFAAKPALNVTYGGRICIGADAFNRFLAGLDDYDIPLEQPAGAHINIKRTRLAFKDGAPAATIDAMAVDRDKIVSIRLRIRADLLLRADPQHGVLVVAFAVKEILPDIKLSIFRWREFWFAASIMRLEAQKYIDSLPAVAIPLNPTLPISLPPHSQSVTGTPAGGTITLLVNTPEVNLSYSYNILQAVTLKDGIHVFLTLTKQGAAK